MLKSDFPYTCTETQSLDETVIRPIFSKTDHVWPLQASKSLGISELTTNLKSVCSIGIFLSFQG